MNYNRYGSQGAVLPDRMARVVGKPRLEAAPVRDEAPAHYERARPTREREPGEKASSYIPWPLRLVLKLALSAALFFGVTVGPSFLDCRKRKEVGDFFYGMTVAACTRQGTHEQIATMQRQLEDVARALGNHLH